MRFCITLDMESIKFVPFSFVPVISMDSDIVALYQKINFAWRYRMKAELQNIPIISIGGGQRDALVRSELIWNRFQHPSPLDIHALVSVV